MVKTGGMVAVGESLIPGAFRSDYTRPTTRYVSARTLAGTAIPADSGQLRLDHSHSPLAWMLVLTQMGTGTIAFGAITSVSPQAKFGISIAAAAIIVLGMTLSVLHLGQPLKAWRTFLGWRKSWLSREIIAFGIFAKLAALTPLVWLLSGDEAWLSGAMALAASAGTAAVACSVMVYVDTQRPFWSMSRVAVSFACTTVALGAGLVALASPPLAAISFIATATFACWDRFTQWQALASTSSAIHPSARVMNELLTKQTFVRRILLSTGSLVFLCGAIISAPSLIAIAVVSTFAALIIDRHHFFTACAGPRMTGP
jgi:formate dehydrogenase iron-sulfur subunit